MHLNVCICRGHRRLSGLFLCHSLLHFLQTVSAIDSEDHSFPSGDRLVSSQDPPVFTSQCWVTHMLQPLTLFMSSGDLNSDPHTYTGNYSHKTISSALFLFSFEIWPHVTQASLKVPIWLMLVWTHNPPAPISQMLSLQECAIIICFPWNYFKKSCFLFTSIEKIIFFEILFFILCVWVVLPGMYMEAKRGHWIPWGWSYSFEQPCGCWQLNQVL